jgi:acetoin utilization protein AcuB
MIAKDLITDDIPTLKITDTGSKAIHWMEEFKVSHIPILKKQEYLGLIGETDILDLNIDNKPLEKFKLSLIRPFVLANQHFYEVIKIFTNMKITVLPVLDDKQNFLGTIPITALLKEFSLLVAIRDPGGIIVLEMNEHDYSMTQIAQIIESNDGKILSCYLNSIENSTRIEITLKTNKEDLSAILQTFGRYNYTIKASFHQAEFKDDIKNRFDLFMNYINM